MFTCNLDPKSKVPLYQQLYEYIQNSINNGELKAEEKLPSKRKLSQHLKISVITIENAYEQLITEGYIYSKPQKGFYVTDIDNTSPIKAPVHNEFQPVIPEKTLPYEFRTNSADINSFPFSTWAGLMREVLRDQDKKLLEKGNPKGLYTLRREIAIYLKAYRNISVSADQIIVGAGSEYLINIILQLLGKNRIYAVENPGYHKIAKIMEANGIEPKYIPLNDDGINMNELINSKANVLHITPSHHFPLGIVTPVKKRNEILNWAYNTDSYIIEDDYDSEFRYTGRPVPALQSLDKGSKVIYLNTFAKNIAPSLRISYMVLPENLAEKYQKEFSFYSNTVSSFEQYTLSKFMAKGNFERYINKMRLIYKQRLDTIINSINSCSLKDFVTVKGEKTGLHILLEVNNGMTEKELVDKARENGILLTGMSQFFHEGVHKGKPTVILGYSGIDTVNIEKAFKILEQIWKF